MRKWGVIITLAYSLFVVALLLPAAHSLARLHFRLEYYQEWRYWIVIGMVLVSQALLLFLSVDTSFQRNKPRAHILVSSLTTAAMLALLTGGVVFSLGSASYGDKFLDFFPHAATVLLGLAAVWLAWTGIFYHYYRDSSSLISKATAWLLKGSILELLVAVPSHVIVRRRHDCSAPMVTSFGIATGIAIMLLSFGPSVLLLYKKRMHEYDTRKNIRRAAAKAN